MPNNMPVSSDVSDLITVDVMQLLQSMLGVRTKSWPTQTDADTWGLPPVGHLGENDGQLKQLLKRSFPLLRLTPIFTKPTEHATNQMPTGPQTGEYKFYCSTEGSMTISHNNEYGPSNIEEGMQNLASGGGVNDLIQLTKSGGAGAAGGALLDVAAKGAEGLRGAINTELKGLKNDSVAKDLINNMASIGVQVLSSMLGARIDIPNIWKDSKSDYGIKVQIKLHTFGVSDADFKRNIINPLSALLAMAFPERQGSGGFGVTYINPPYLEAQLEGLFYSKLCGITDISIEFPYKSTSMWMGHPREVNIDLTIKDMYNVIVYDDKYSSAADPAPTTFSILRKLETEDRELDGAPAFFENALIIGNDLPSTEDDIHRQKEFDDEIRRQTRYNKNDDRPPAGYESPSRITETIRLDANAADASTHPGSNNGDLMIPYTRPRTMSSTGQIKEN